MKRFINFLSIGLIAAITVLPAKSVNAQPRAGVSINFQTFYDELSPYGEWIDYPEYGYTWRPRVGTDFRPYSTNGYWVYTNDYDWMWNSGYDWGWAPFHYGRWFYDPLYGWLWVPGYDWSPAWVSWRGGGDYYGWAPIRPGISISIGFGGYNPPYDYWTFAPCRYMTSRYIGRYYYPYRNNVTIINRTTIINNYGNRGGRGGSYINGPRRTDVERYTGRISAVSVRTTDRPGRASVSRNSISVYRPAVDRSRRSNYTPRSVQSYNRSGTASRSTVRNNEKVSSTRRETGNNTSGGSRFNTSPRRQDAISGRSNTDNSNRSNNTMRQNRSAVQQNSTTNNSQRNNSAESNASRQMQAQRSRERQQEVQRQQQANRANERSAEMTQRNAAIQQRQNQERVEAQQRAAQAQVQRESQTRSREVQVQRQPTTPRVESRHFESRSSSPARSSSGSSERSVSRGRR